MEYQTQENRIRTPTPAGSEELKIYGETIDNKGRTYLKQTGKENIYQKIQASLEETKTYNILEQFAQSGDEAILNRRQAVYGNFLNIPTNPAELQNTIMEAERTFESLDKDVRAEFGNDVGQFKQAILNNEIEQRLSKYTKQQNKQTTNTTTTENINNGQIQQQTQGGLTNE